MPRYADLMLLIPKLTRGGNHAKDTHPRCACGSSRCCAVGVDVDLGRRSEVQGSGVSQGPAHAPVQAPPVAPTEASSLPGGKGGNLASRCAR